MRFVLCGPFLPVPGGGRNVTCDGQLQAVSCRLFPPHSAQLTPEDAAAVEASARRLVESAKKLVPRQDLPHQDDVEAIEEEPPVDQHWAQVDHLLAVLHVRAWFWSAGCWSGGLGGGGV
jgi:hypothetical protein